MKVPISLLFIAVVISWTGNGCSTRDKSPGPVSDTLYFEDSLGRTVPVKSASVKRIVTLTPALTETVYALGHGDRVVGVSNFSNYPDEAKTKPDVGGPIEKQLNFERIVELKPDLVLADGGFQRNAVETLAKLGIKVYAFEVDHIGDVGSMLLTVSKMLGCTEASKDVVNAFENEITNLQKNRYAQTPSVFYLFGDPLFTAGGTSFTNELIERAGGVNLFRDVEKKSFQASEEELIKRNPDVIVLPRRGDPDQQIAEILARPTWKTLNAIKSRRIILLDEDSSSRPGPRILEAVRELENALHPQTKTP